MKIAEEAPNIMQAGTSGEVEESFIDISIPAESLKDCDLRDLEYV